MDLAAIATETGDHVWSYEFVSRRTEEPIDIY
jgi:hypothetical protein